MALSDSDDDSSDDDAVADAPGSEDEEEQDWPADDAGLPSNLAVVKNFTATVAAAEEAYAQAAQRAREASKAHAAAQKLQRLMAERRQDAVNREDLARLRARAAAEVPVMAMPRPPPSLAQGSWVEVNCPARQDYHGRLGWLRGDSIMHPVVQFLDGKSTVVARNHLTGSQVVPRSSDTQVPTLDMFNVGDDVCMVRAPFYSKVKSGHVGAVLSVKRDPSENYPVEVAFYDPYVGVVESHRAESLCPLRPCDESAQEKIPGPFVRGQKVRRATQPVAASRAAWSCLMAVGGALGDGASPPMLPLEPPEPLEPPGFGYVWGVAPFGHVEVVFPLRNHMTASGEVSWNSPSMPREMLPPCEIRLEADWQRERADNLLEIIQKLGLERDEAIEKEKRLLELHRAAGAALMEATAVFTKAQASLANARSRAKAMQLKTFVRFRPDGARPTAWRDLAKFVDFEWCLRVHSGAAGGRAIALPLIDALPLAKSVLDTPEHFDDDDRLHDKPFVLTARGAPLKGLQGVTSRMATLAMDRNLARTVRRRTMPEAEKPKAVHSISLLKAALGALDCTMLDSEVQAFFDSPETGIIRARDVPVPRSLDGVLRPYQVSGFQWLLNNCQNGLGCILADDMGLGKTLQAIALLQQMKDSGLLSQPALVVVPTGLLANWAREVKKWSDDLSVHIHHGSNRRLPSFEGLAAPEHSAAAPAPAASAEHAVDAVAAPSRSDPGAARPQRGLRWRRGALGLRPGVAVTEGVSADVAGVLGCGAGAGGGGSSSSSSRPGGAGPRSAGRGAGRAAAPAVGSAAPAAGDAAAAGRRPPLRRLWSAAAAGESADIFLTSYGVLSRDVNKFVNHARFSCVVLDEAQQIKNYNTLVTKSVKRIAEATGNTRLALSGTPVENKLADLHSQFEFILPGYLANNRTEFERDFSKAIAGGNLERQRLLQRMIAPFVMRRLKSDPKIAADLPDKVEQVYDCELASFQKDLYRAVQEHEFRGLAQEGPAAGQGRRFAVLAMMHALREVCNHPANLKESRWPAAVPEGQRPARGAVQASGKCVVLQEILSGVIANGEKAIIFCQYLETIAILEEQIRDNFNCVPLTFVGKMDRMEREKAVEKFQTEQEHSVMLLSIQAGGVGITLTAATHVIHFDRCFNPAKENQATDRAHRIGQTRTVFVHRLVTKDTFEEKLAKVLAARQSLSDITVQAGEGWIADFDDEALRQLFSLSPQAPGSSGGAAAAGEVPLRAPTSVFGEDSDGDSSQRPPPPAAKRRRRAQRS